MIRSIIARVYPEISITTDAEENRALQPLKKIAKNKAALSRA